MPRMQECMSHHHPPERPGARPLQLILPLLLAFVLLASALLPAMPALAHPQLILPTPPGEAWRIIQGYACGTHNAWDRYSLDLAGAGVRTYGAPVRAAADGTIWNVEQGSGTLILSHGGGFYTMYTHMGSFVTTARNSYVRRGALLGTVGDRGTRGNPHLHFTAFTASSASMRSWRSVPLTFAEGYNLPEIGGCNQHGGKVLTASGEIVGAQPTISFSSTAEPGKWYTSDQRIEFTTSGAWQGISQAWNEEPKGDTPMFPNASAGYAQLADAGEGEHVLYVAAWGADGKRTITTFGPIGYDTTPPRLSVAMASPTEVQAGSAVPISWTPAEDSASGVAGYRVYVGANADGSDEWYVTEPKVEIPSLEAGTYLVRVQAVDVAGNAGAWYTVSTIVSKAAE